ncbi:MAG: hypothetical protein RIR26_2640 [Pseudomonadota bacterium]
MSEQLQKTFVDGAAAPTDDSPNVVVDPEDEEFTYPQPLNLRSLPKLTQSEALNRISLKLTGKPAALAFSKRPDLLQSDAPSALTDAFDYLTSRDGENAREFSNWVVSVVRDQWKIQVIRNDGVCEWCTWRMAPTPEVLAFNRRYLTRRPDRIFFDPENQGIFGGDGFEIPPSNFDVPGDAGYALYEFEPLVFAAHVVLNNQRFSLVVNGAQTVRSAALQEFSSNFTEENPKLTATSFSVPHWSGDWNHYERKDKAGRAWGGGILSTIGFLRTYVRERTWAARGIYEAMLCRSISDSPVPPLSLKLEKVGDSNPLLAGASCKGCHNMLDGLSNLRMEYTTHRVKNIWNGDLLAEYPANYKNLYETGENSGLEYFREKQHATVTQWPMSHYLLSNSGAYIPVKSMEELGTAIGTLPEFHSCQVNAFVDAVVKTNDQTLQKRLRNEALAAYYAEGESIKAALRTIVTSEVFLERQH